MADLTPEDLEAKIAELESKIEHMDRLNKKTPPADYTLAKYDLNENEEAVLRFISVGLPDQEAIAAAGLSSQYVTQRLKASIQFAAAYQELSDMYDKWAETQLKFIMPLTWARVDDILSTDAASFIPTDPAFARNVLQAQTKLGLQLMRLNYAKEHRVTVSHKMDPAMLQIQQDNATLFAEMLQSLSARDITGELDRNLPQRQIIDVVAVEENPTFKDNPQDEFGRYKCLECNIYVEDLPEHLHVDHEILFTTYLRKYGIEPGSMLSGSE